MSNLSEKITLRVTYEEKLLLDEQAKSAGLTLTKYVRSALFDNRTLDKSYYSALQSTVKLSTLLNKYEAYGEEEHLKSMKKEVDSLWQALSS